MFPRRRQAYFIFFITVAQMEVTQTLFSQFRVYLSAVLDRIRGSWDGPDGAGTGRGVFLAHPAVRRPRSPGQNGMTNGKWYAIKVEQRLSGSSCVTTFHLSGTEIFNEVHTCGSYTTETTKLWAAGYRSAGDYASGSISHFRFIWL